MSKRATKTVRRPRLGRTKGAKGQCEWQGRSKYLRQLGLTIQHWGLGGPHDRSRDWQHEHRIQGMKAGGGVLLNGIRWK